MGAGKTGQGEIRWSWECGRMKTLLAVLLLIALAWPK
jgi:hypothetical protein